MPKKRLLHVSKRNLHLLQDMQPDKTYSCEACNRSFRNIMIYCQPCGIQLCHYCVIFVAHGYEFKCPTPTCSTHISSDFESVCVYPELDTFQYTIRVRKLLNQQFTLTREADFRHCTAKWNDYLEALEQCVASMTNPVKFEFAFLRPLVDLWFEHAQNPTTPNLLKITQFVYRAADAPLYANRLCLEC